MSSYKCKLVSLLNPELKDQVPKFISSKVVSGPLTPVDLEQKRDLPSSFLFDDNVNLKWLTWNGFLPNGAVSIYNGYTKRTDYVCKYQCEAGFYNPSLGPYCRYPYGDREYYASSGGSRMKLLVLILLSALQAISSASLKEIVKKSIQHGKGDEYWYKHYQVLTINRDAYTQHITDVKYGIDEVAIYQYAPETMHNSRVTNNECQAIVKTATISKTSEVEKTWNIGRATKIGITSSITANIPLIGSAGIEMSVEKTMQFSSGLTVVESVSHSVSVELKVQPNHSCRVRMEGRKMKADIPFTARLSRTYRNGQTRWTSDRRSPGRSGSL
ncbi:PREDICTED: natterin-3-like [Cyprinodon variegatus]|uniref:natterin-3-like n=1 Tax=Cyprinodon variegatus TaxID=28743 RepID=UPI000742A014|nr:PREDICTED: natterin-3-like [Cyprinodon variegatus]